MGHAVAQVELDVDAPATGSPRWDVAAEEQRALFLRAIAQGPD
ncbi:hypothetical protein ACFQBY_22120 [Promicromonospora citrea]|uniref:Uncharacterized protein n=1 Tax=Promicromonospora citrea TaxID=43677 RepID=A0A8H9L8N2_9MICO|nr:hypothetical protein [Promicromonospora citrea]GGM43903.1 hypothetical protein GCM10010102_44200 [Promicromonospora citrea]